MGIGSESVGVVTTVEGSTSGVWSVAVDAGASGAGSTAGTCSAEGITAMAEGGSGSDIF